jgi:probable rRNA maturation factor
MNPHLVHIQIAGHFSQLPTRQELREWVNTALADCHEQQELTLRIVDETESAQLNTQYRHKSGPTNVLSFSCGDFPAGIPNNLLGDIAICAPLVAQEAKNQGKPPKAHWAHLVVHGVLHLRGYDHENTEDAHIMEAEEITILTKLKFANPYQITQR